MNWKAGRFLHDLTLIVLIVGLAYLGGYYFGRHPRSIRELGHSRSIVVATTQANLLTPPLQAWLEDRWGHSLIVEVWSPAEIAEKWKNADLLLLTHSEIKPLYGELAPLPGPTPTDKILPDFLIGDREKVAPVLWRLYPREKERQHLLLLTMGAVHSSPQLADLMSWLLNPDFQTRWSESTGFYPVLENLMKESPLRQIPLDHIRYD